MKKIILSLALALFSFASFGQNENYPIVITLQGGPSMSKIAMLGQLGQPEYNTATSKLCYSLMTDYSLGRISVGGGFSLFGAQINTNLGTVDGSGWSILGRALIHFGYKSNEKLDIFTGVGLGVGVWTYESDFKRDPYSDFGKSSGAQFLIPFSLGGRYFLKNNIGFTLELSTNLNQPISAGVSYRL